MCAKLLYGQYKRVVAASWSDPFDPSDVGVGAMRRQSASTGAIVTLWPSIFRPRRVTSAAARHKGLVFRARASRRADGDRLPGNVPGPGIRTAR